MLFVFPLTKYNTTLSPGFLGQRFNNLRRAVLLTSLIQYGEDFDVIGSIIFGRLHFWRHWFNMAKILSKFGEQQLVMVNYTCGFHQSEMGKYFQWTIIYIMGFNIKNGLNENGILKIPKWPSLRACSIKEWIYTSSWIVGKFRVHLWEMLLGSKVFLSSNFFHTNLNFKNSTRQKISFFDARGFKLGFFMFSTGFFYFWYSFKLWPILLWKVGHVMA